MRVCRRRQSDACFDNVRCQDGFDVCDKGGEIVRASWASAWRVAGAPAATPSKNARTDGNGMISCAVERSSICRPAWVNRLRALSGSPSENGFRAGFSPRAISACPMAWCPVAVGYSFHMLAAIRPPGLSAANIARHRRDRIGDELRALHAQAQVDGSILGPIELPPGQQSSAGRHLPADPRPAQSLRRQGSSPDSMSVLTTLPDGDKCGATSRAREPSAASDVQNSLARLRGSQRHDTFSPWADNVFAR